MNAASAFVVRRLLHRTGRGKLTIMLYHRVHTQRDPLFPSVVDAQRFDEQMAWVAATLDVLPLPEAVDMLRADRLPPAAACVTFDDGYADNKAVALPILLRHRVPATFFVASGYLDGGCMWNDTIIESMRGAPGDRVDLTALDLGVHPIDGPLSRRAAIDRILDQVKYRGADERNTIAAEIARALGGAQCRTLMMTSDDVRALHDAGMTIGAHTVTHPILARLDDASARDEIRAGRDALQAITGAPVTLFAYPNGRPGTDYSPAHAAMVRDMGFAAALTTRRAFAHAGTDPYELPRFTPWGRGFLGFSAGFARNHLGYS